MTKDNIVAMDGHHGMNRERYEQMQHQEYLESLPGNPDNHEFYPGEQEALLSSTTSIAYLVEMLGVQREASNAAYNGYKVIKETEDQIRFQLEMKLRDMELKSAKGADYTVSIASKPTIIVTREVDVIEWLKNTPDVESDFYIGLKATEFKSLAQSLLKNTGELVPGTEVVIKESLSIRSNTIKKAA